MLVRLIAPSPPGRTQPRSPGPSKAPPMRLRPEAPHVTFMSRKVLARLG